MYSQEHGGQEALKQKNKKIAEWISSDEFINWKKEIVRKRLETLDNLLSSGEWISNTKMLEEVNKLYLVAPNEDCYDPVVPHRIVESDEVKNNNTYERALSMAYSGTIRQDRLTINKILRIVGKEHIFEKKEEGEGVEGLYRYKTKYSIFEKHSISDIELDDYELYRSVPVIKDKPDEPKKENLHIEEVSDHIENLDFPTEQALKRITKAFDELQLIRDYNSYYFSNLLENAHNIYEAKHEGWEKELLKTLLYAYNVASHPQAGVDEAQLFRIRELLIWAKDITSDYRGIVALLKKQYMALDHLNLPSDVYDKDYILFQISYYAFASFDVEEMVKELNDYYISCSKHGNIIPNEALRYSLGHIREPNKWKYNELLLSKVDRLIAFIFSVDQRGVSAAEMLVGLFFLKLNIKAAGKGEKPISKDEIMELSIDYGWEHPLFKK